MGNNDAVVLAAARSPLARSHRGAFAYTRIDDIAAQVIAKLMTDVPGLAPADIEDVLVGCAMPEGEQGLNVARQIALLAGLPVETAAVTINRCCASSLEAIAQAARAAALCPHSCFIAGGIESMTHIPPAGFNPSLNERLMREGAPNTYIAMGLAAENLARHYAITRKEQDRFALASHHKAMAAQSRGTFNREIVAIDVLRRDGSSAQATRDEGPRSDTSLEVLATLKPAFAEGGTVTAGNSSPLTDGAAFVVIAGKKFAKRLGVQPKARIRSCAVAGVDPCIMGMGPVRAVSKALARAKMKLKDIDLIELNEAFASQAIAVMRELDLDGNITNVHGGAIALGHPLGAAGARLVTSMINAMSEHDASTGLAAMCVGGGQGMALIVERY